MKLNQSIPAVIGLFFFLDIGGRFVPLRLFTFRAWEAVQRYPHPDGPFAPNVRYVGINACGDLANASNRPTFCQSREETFSTDAFGFRTHPDAAGSAPAKAIVIGDSFAGGACVRDDQTLPAQFQALTGWKTYNGACIKNDLTHLMELTQRLHMDKGVILYAFLTRQQATSQTDARMKEWRMAGFSRRDMAHLWHCVKNVWTGFWKVTPLEILSQHACKRIQNDRILPNPYATMAVETRLRNGTMMLQLPVDIKNFHTPWPAVNVDGFVALHRELGKRHFDLWVILVPDKYTVYQPLLETSPAEAPMENSYLKSIERGLTRAHIPVINLTEALRAQAAEALSRNRYNYALDDSHWNEAGIRLATEHIARAVTGRVHDGSGLNP
jgi:hypothetical protein